ncbi:FAD-dependent oxidoreductase [Pseudogracilibacillus auburnensis]|uniref:FAD dependent oxidoreductase n=1 Tax=Pseudogracilibacillus auburnensis TaxID=1494959 RepID=A0A2V3WAB7_9BACI|nr:FAD-dependent oxidoreductase [Pseudogracilibacillus auburnensis]PXW90168.1 FAD dependent oxidoreductase [Pseudogracilibacillus auburnensis]
MHREKRADVIVLGGGLGGCMASLAAAKMGLNVILTEETDWIGGQLTSQGVPLDEHPWIEQFGCTATYREFRNKVREYYKTNYPLTDAAKKDDFLNPGNAWVSRLSHEPKVALKVLEDMLAPYVNSGRIQICYHYKPDSASTVGDFVTSVTVRHLSKGDKITLFGKYFIDATEVGDVLPLANVEYVTGAESKETTGEPHALEQEDPLDMQSITYVFAVDYLEGKDYTIEKPEQYEFWKQFIPSYSTYPLLSWYAVNSEDTSTLKEFTLLPNDQDIPSLFTYRRALAVDHLSDAIYEGDVSLINWPQNDYFLGAIVDVSEEVRKKNLHGAKQLSLSLLYWLQTEAPRLDGGKGYPGLRLRKDVLGTEDGLAKYPYIRESRRIKAVYTITETDVNKQFRGEKGILQYKDSIGVGSYHLDLHHTVHSNRTFYLPSYPYEIPLGAVLPTRVRNVLPACKNIGTTQITNGCYRVHPTEWNIGESVGYLAAYAILNNISAHDVRENQDHLLSYQGMLKQNGIQLHWPEDIDLA